MQGWGNSPLFFGDDMQHERMIKYFLEADSKEELVQSMIDNNARFGAGMVYDCPQKDGKKWVTWFTVSIVELVNRQIISPEVYKVVKRG